MYPQSLRDGDEGRPEKRKVCMHLRKECGAGLRGNWHPRRATTPMKNSFKLLLTSLAFAAGTTAAIAAPAAENWENNCTKCHGADGKGQTKVGKKLNLKDYTD